MMPYRISTTRLQMATKMEMMSTPFATSMKSRLLMPFIITLPRPGMTNRLSIRTVEPTMEPRRIPMVVTMGIMELRS